MSGNQSQPAALDIVPTVHRDVADHALRTVLDGELDVSLSAVSGGASGALVYRADRQGAPPLLLRIETARDLFRNPHRSYPCLLAAADAGIAPSVHLADPDAGAMVMDFIAQRPITDHPGGPVGVVGELGSMLARLQSTPVSPPLLENYPAVLEGMLAYVEGAGVFDHGVLAPVRDGLARIVEVYPWHLDAEVSSHNDVNPYNVLFDGERLWLIDWELAFRNDRVADVACVMNNFADPEARENLDPNLETSLLAAWLGRAPEPIDRSRLAVMRQLNRLFYAFLMLTATPGGRQPEPDLSALAADQFRDEIATGRLALGSPDLLPVMGKMQLAGFLSGFDAPRFTEALRTVANA